MIALIFLVIGVTAQTKTGIVKGRLVYTSCASVVVEILSEEYYYLGQEEWEAPNDNSETYQHVFLVKNRCDFLRKNIGLGEEFEFVVEGDNGKNTGCVQCLMYDSPPHARLTIDVVKRKNNEQ